MRAPVIGLWFADDAEKRNAFVQASTAITHRDPRATETALIIAEATAIAGSKDPKPDDGQILDHLEHHVVSDEMRLRLTKLREHLDTGLSVREFADSFGRKKGFVSGFAPDTAAVALFAWLLHRGDFTATVESVIRAGGDTDTVAFVAGSLAGAECGTDGLNATWLAALKDWPLSVDFLRAVVETGQGTYPRWPVLLFRNAIFLTIVLVHGFRRLLPAY